jgi:hypothetical protein
MQQYYGGAFGLGAQPQPRRQRPRNPFRREQPFVQPAVMDMSSQSTAQPVSSPVGVSQSVVNPIQYDTAALPTSFFSPGAFDRSLLDDLNYMRF